MLNQIIDKLILYALGIIMLTTSDSFAEPVLVLLVVFILAGLDLCVQNERIFTALLFGFVLLCFVKPEYTYFLPLIAYESGIRDKRMGFCSLFLFFYAVSGYEVWQILLWLIACVLAIFLSIRTSKIDKLEKELIRLRDTSTELNMVLKEKNRNLMEKQDYEIHLATLRERNRIAREIHDNVGHMLSRSILQIGALSTIYKEEPMHGQLVSVNETLNTAMNNIRESVHDLHDDSIDLKQALLEATKTMNEKYRLQIDYDMSQVIPSNVKYCFLMIVKEAMSNVVKHSNADTVMILVREHPAFYQLAIEDNGTVEPQNLEGGIGLENMKTRVDAVQGTFHATYNKGFKIIVTVKKGEEK